MSTAKEQRFLKSARDEHGAKIPAEEVLKWLAWRNREVDVRGPLDQLPSDQGARFLLSILRVA